MLRKKGQEVVLRVCDYYTSTYPCLGTNEPVYFNDDTPYGMLYRPSIMELPDVHSVEAIFNDAETEALYRGLYNGSMLVIKWFHWFEKPLHINLCLPSYTVSFYTTRADNGLQRLGSLEWLVNATEAGTNFQHYMTHAVDYLKQLMPSQQGALQSRIKHLLLRLSGCNFGTISYGALSLILMDIYVGQGRRNAEILDLSIVSADVALQHQAKLTFRKGINMVAMDLEACARFREAAGIFGQIADFWTAEPSENFPDGVHKPEDSHLPVKVWFTVKQRYSQGNAFTLSKDWDDAERSLICALNTVGQNLPIDVALREYHFEKCIHRLTDLYEYWSNESLNGKKSERLLEVAGLLFVAYLHASGVRDVHGVRIKYLLSESYCNNPIAMKTALQQACAADSTQAFRSIVRSWKRPGIDKSALPRFQVDLNQARKSTKEIARDTRHSYLIEDGKSQVHISCNNPGCFLFEQSKVLTCTRCRSVQYW
ncbi:hypothetical protein MPSEU_000309500 [Mayamaea pseudoterrestris]|nr:hypothetical protein MPSEU_000309500 [Mayamaea pseudoterrestris]